MKFKGKEGITLIALVITIIVLLILSTVTIYLMLKGNGLIQKTQYAKTIYKINEYKEKLELKIQEIQIEKKGDATLQDVVDYLDNDNEYTYIVANSKIATVTGLKDVNGCEEIYVLIDQYQYLIKKDLTVTYISEKEDGEYDNDDIQYIDEKVVEILSQIDEEILTEDLLDNEAIAEKIVELDVQLETQEFKQQTLSSDITQVEEGKIEVTASSYYIADTAPHKAFLNKVSSVVDSDYWQINNTTTEQWLQIKYPYYIVVEGINYTTRPRDHYNGTVTAYTSSRMNKKMAEPVTTNISVKEYSFSFPKKVITDTVYFRITNQEKWYGMQNVQIKGKKILKSELEKNPNELLKQVKYIYTIEDLLKNNRIIDKVLASKKALEIINANYNITEIEKCNIIQEYKKQGRDVSLLKELWGIEEFIQPILSSDITQVEEGKIEVTASSYYIADTAPHKAFLNKVSNVVDSDYWQINNTTTEQWLQIKYPYTIYIQSIDFYSRPRDNSRGVVTVYNSKNKEQKIGNSATVNAVNTKYVINNIKITPTDTICFNITNHESWFGMQNVQIKGFRFKK